MLPYDKILQHHRVFDLFNCAQRPNATANDGRDFAAMACARHCFCCCCIWCIERTARGTFARRTSSHIVCHLAMRHFLFFVWARSSAHTRQRRRRWQAPLQHHIKCDNVITRNAKMTRRPRRPGAKRLTVTATVTLDGSAEYNVYMCVYAFQKDGKRERRMRVPLTMQTPSWWRVRGAERLTISKLAT